MKKTYNYLKLLPILLLGCNWGATAQSTVFTYSGIATTYTVPPNTFTVFVNALGGDGASDYHGYSTGGNGAAVNCALAVTPGQVLNVYVGGAGMVPFSLFGGGAGGFNGGGAGTGNGGGGGGSSDIRYPGTTITDRVIVAGGGAGAGQDCSAAPGDNGENGGPGGGLTGGDGFDGYLNTPLKAGTQTTGFGQPNGGPGGPFYSGGNGGGGGGYWGGLCGENNSFVVVCTGAGGGGGGSSYTDPATVTGAVHIRAGNGLPGLNPGQITICAPGVAGGIVPAPICVGGTPGTFVDTGGTPGGTWESSNTGVAQIGSSTGIATGIAFGPVVITYHANTPCGNAFTTVTITVASGANPITGYDTLCVGTSTTLSDGPSGTWTSQFPAIAGVGGGTGIVTGGATGTSTITYTIPGGCYATQSVVVLPAIAPITGPTSYVFKGVDSVILTDATPGGTWYSTFPTVATVDTFTGVVKGVAVSGSTDIMYTVAGCVVPYLISSNAPPYAITGTSTICQGDATTLSEFTITGSWATSSPGVATVTTGGVVTGVAGGPAIISYTVLGCPSALFPMTINPTPAGIVGITSICIGSTSVVLTDTDPMGTWMSSDTTVATISPTGVVTVMTGVIGLTTTITYTLPTTCYITLLETTSSGPAPITGLTSICQGSSTTLADATPGGTWSSTALAIAQVVDTSGVVNGILAGAVDISYTLPSGCFSLVSPFIVQPPIPAAVTVAKFPNSDTVCAGTPIMYVATPINGGIATFTWYKFTALQPSGIDTLIDTPIHGDVIIVKMRTSGICSLVDTVFDSVSMNVYPNVAPTVNIALIAQHDTLQYIGQVFTFNSNVLYGGNAAAYQWYGNGLLITGATNSSYATPVYGQESFYCKVTGNAPCDSITHTSTSNVITIGDYLGVANTSNLTTGLSLFPNPTSGTITLSGTVSTVSDNKVTIEVTDMLGHTLYTAAVAAQNGALHEQIVMDNVANGTYLLRVTTGSSSETFHFVLNK
jgi:glycine rich protein/type IX secretion system substrate protein